MINVLWLQGGACSGNTMSFLNAQEPTVVELVTDFGINILWHPSIGLEIGEQVVDLLKDCISEKTKLDILVYEGSIIQGPHGKGTMNYFADRPMKDWVKELSEVAQFVVAIGDCATWGGIPAVAPNPSESTGVQFLKRDKGGFLGSDYKSRSGLPVINIPGCPAHPDWITQILVGISTGRAKDILLDDFHRPKTFFTDFVQSGCPNVTNFMQKVRRPFREARRLPVLRSGLPRTHDPRQLQPYLVEPTVEQNPGEPPLPGLHRTGLPPQRSGEGQRIQNHALPGYFSQGSAFRRAKAALLRQGRNAESIPQQLRINRNFQVINPQ